MSEWLINLNHSSAVFAARHMMVSWVWGQFSNITGRLDFDPQRVADAKVAAEIDAASIYTGVERRDLHLKSPDFLDVANYPTITFKSTGVEPDGLDRALVQGDLTLRGVTKPAVLDACWSGPAHFEDEGKIYTSFGFQGRTTINREDFGMTFNLEMEHGGLMVSRLVHLILSLEVDLAGAQKPF
ncbi:MAG: YceI family protein [Deltaproteobacteria bacterium]|nr:YceI family protein [Deltaproteobacteria bacterium]